MRDQNTDFGTCAGCEQWLDPTITHHVFDVDHYGRSLNPPIRYHLDCCPGKHVTGSCGQEVVEE